MKEIIKPTYKKIPYIHGWNLENFPFIEDDFDMITTYQFMCKLVKYINELISNSKVTEETVVALYNYVVDYFNNLDVQEEINNKLDEMVESGELAEIISIYLNANCILSYNTVADMKSATNLVNGSFTKTYGKLTYNDGLGNFYKIRNVLSTDVVDEDNIVSITSDPTIIAEKIPDNYIGNLSLLETTSKQVVGAINEVKTNLTNAVSDIENSIDEVNDDISDINDEIDKIKAKKRMLLFGDSWAMPNYPYVTNQSNCWYNKVADFLNANLTNYAQSGAGFLINNNTILSQVNNAIATETHPEEVDYIFVEGGYNDLNFTNNVAYATIIDSVKAVFNAITSTFINAKVYFLADNTPHKLLKTETGTQSQYYNTYGFYQYFESAIMECNSTNITIINMMPFLLGFTDSVNETLHPNDKGMKILSKSIIDTLCGSYTRQSIVTGSDVYSLVVAEPGSPTLTNTKNIINQDYIDVTFRLVQTHSDNNDLMYAYYVDELPFLYLPENISVISTNGKKTISATILQYQNRNLMQIQLPAQTTGTFDIVLRIPLK